MTKVVIYLTKEELAEFERLLGENWGDQSWPLQLASLVRKAVERRGA